MLGARAFVDETASGNVTGRGDRNLGSEEHLRTALLLYEGGVDRVQVFATTWMLTFHHQEQTVCAHAIALTALAKTRATVANEINASAIMMTRMRVLAGGVSVGPNASAVVKETKR